MSLAVQRPPISFLQFLAHREGLDESLENFIAACSPPEDFTGLLFVCRKLRSTFEALPAEWHNSDPFRGWGRLFELFEQNSFQIREMSGEQVAIGVDPSIPVPNSRLLLFGLTDQYPLFAMLCTLHEADPDATDFTSSLEFKYSALQLQIVHAHWRKIKEFREHRPDAALQIREGRRHGRDDWKSDIRMSNDAARAVRKLQSNDLADWLGNLDAVCHPDKFNDALMTAPPKDREARDVYERIARYCAPGYLPGRGGPGGEKVGFRRSPFTVDYMGRRFGLLTDGHEDEGTSAKPEHVIRTVPRRSRLKHQESLSQEEVLGLGLDPIELADGSAVVLDSVPPGGTRRDTHEDSRARTRGFEIDRSLFPWNSQAIRLEDFLNEIVPRLRTVLKKQIVETDEVAAATALAIAAETGRSLNQVLDLKVEDDPHSAFAYRPPAHGQRLGLWKWDAAAPLYKTERSRLDAIEVKPAKYLTYPASELVSDLVAKFMKLASLIRKDGRLFPYKPASLRRYIREWLDLYHVSERISPVRISNLMWGLLHKSTGGELASACLVLGLHQPMAQVELFYAVLSDTESASLFAKAQAVLWGKVSQGSGKAALLPDPPTARFTGCRQFPRIEAVQGTIKRLRKGSRALFGIPLDCFDSSKHKDAFNAAVLYAVWHQFFSFGTRAVKDAYIPIGQFSQSGIAVLSDKDFATGYKTRVVVAHDHLLNHMQALEQWLAALREKNPTLAAPDLGPVWLFDAHETAVRVTPSAIEEVLRKEFPLPVNTHRKMMRYLLRKQGMSHAHCEAYMGHWWHGREPFSPFSTFDFRAYVHDLRKRMPTLLRKTLGFSPVSGARAK